MSELVTASFSQSVYWKPNRPKQKSQFYVLAYTNYR